ncbi:MAG: hypothetical protein IPF47_13915 [Gemmatimonadetes bacterium]|nr:hypothetical protein [Gemmatimonadota bacterium]
MAATPDVLLLDEPFAALDPALRREVRDAVVALLDANGPAVVVVTHDVDEAVQFAHRMAVLLPSGWRRWTRWRRCCADRRRWRWRAFSAAQHRRWRGG